MKYRYVLKNIHTGKTHFKKYDIVSIEREGLKGLFDIENYVIITRDIGTGLKDKNGVDVFEGDIVKANWSYAKEAVIEWMPKRCSFHCKPINNGFAAYDKGYKLNSAKLEITGNIHD